MWRKPSYLVGRHPIWRPHPERSRSLAWGARLESVFPSRERGFESLPRSLSPQGGQERPAQWSGFLSLKAGLRKNAWCWNLDELQTHSCGWAGGIWISHSSLTNLMKRGDTIAYGISLLMLLFVALLRFSTALLVTHISGLVFSISTVIYDINVLIASLTLRLPEFYVTPQPQLVFNELANDSREYTASVGSRLEWVHL